MADHVLQFSASLSELTGEEEEWLRRTLGYLMDRSDQEDLSQETDFICKFYEDCTYFDFRYHLGVDNEARKPRIFFFSNEEGSPYQVALVVHEFLKHFRPGTCWSLTFSVSNTELRPDEFSGGAYFVTAEMIHTLHASDWCARMTEEYELKKIRPRS